MPITSWPASAISPATTELSTPPDMATTIFMLLLIGPDGAGEFDRQPVQRLGDDDLAAQARGFFQPKGKIQHIFLVFRRRLQLSEPVGIDDDMAGGTGQRTLAGAF